MNGIRLAVAAAALWAGTATPALAASMPNNNPDRFERVLKAAGYNVTRGKDSTDTTKLTVKTPATNFSVYFYNCDDNDKNCMSFQLQAGYDMKTPSTAAKMNEWNSTKRLVRAYLDDEGDPYIAVDISMNAPGGMSDDLVIDNVKWFQAMAEAFQKFVGF